MEYKLIFDLRTSQMPLTSFLFVIPGLVIFFAGLTTLLFKRRLTNPFRKVPPMPARLPGFLILLGLLWVQLSGLFLYVQYNYLDKAVAEGKVDVAEGRVARFVPASLTNQHEYFCIKEQNECFSYSDYGITPGFHQTQSNGGPIQSGLPVRVTYKRGDLGDNTIVKLEVALRDAAYTNTVSSGKIKPPEASLSPAR